MTEEIKAVDAKQGSKGYRVALVVITSMVVLTLVGWSII